MRTAKVVKEVSNLQRLTDAVAAFYKEKGDKTISGVVVAHLPGRGYYASVARYPSTPYHKEVVCHSDNDCASPEVAVHQLSLRWLALTGDLDAKAKIDALKKNLSLEDMGPDGN